MKAKRKSLIVKAHLEQKESHEVRMPDGSVINLYIGRKYGENNREINPTVVEVISVGDEIEDVLVGDTLIVHHNLIINEANHIKRDGQIVWMGIGYNDLIYAKVFADGTLEPVYRCVLAERITKPKVSEFEFEAKTEPMKFKVLKTPMGYSDVKAGDIVLAYKLSDYEMVYHHNNKECRAIRINTEDILGVYN